MLKNSKDPRWIRFKLVSYAKKHGIKAAARAFRTTPRTVRKWYGRWRPGTLQGLADQSKAPKSCPHKIAASLEAEIVQLKRQLPAWGAVRLKRDFNLPCSEKAILRVYRQQGLTKKRRRKHQTKNDLRAIKAAWPLFSQIVADTKNLDDIPEYWPQMKHGDLPQIQYTAREVVSGLQFLAFAQERSLAYSRLFAERICQHLAECGVDLSSCTWQTDNGSEYIGSWQAKQPSAFTRTVEDFPGQRHHTIPPGAYTYQSDVETVHALIEDELYIPETFSSRREFLDKASSYQLFFNLARNNHSKGGKTPWDIIKARNPTISPKVVLLPPVFLDELFAANMSKSTKGEYHVPSYASCWC